MKRNEFSEYTGRHEPGLMLHEMPDPYEAERRMAKIKLWLLAIYMVPASFVVLAAAFGWW